MGTVPQGAVISNAFPESPMAQRPTGASPWPATTGTDSANWKTA